MIVAKLRTMTFVKYKHNPFVFQRQKPLLIVATILRIKGNAQFLDGRHNNFVRIVLRQHTTHESVGISVLFHTTFLELVEFLTGLLVKVFSIHHKQTFLNIWIVFQQCRSLERSQSLTTSGSMPNVTITSVFVDTVCNGLHCIYLVWAHHEHLSF